MVGSKHQITPGKPVSSIVQDVSFRVNEAFSTSQWFVTVDVKDRIIPVIKEEKYAHLKNASNYNSPRLKENTR